MKRTRELRLLCAGQTLQIAGLSLAMPYMALYLHRERALGMGRVGLFLAATMAATALGQAAGGRLSDALGRRRVMMASLVGRSAFTAALASVIHARAPLAAVAAAQMAGAFAGNLYFPAAQAWVADRYGRHERLEAFGWMSVATNLGWAMGPAFGGLFVALSYSAMFLASACVCLLCALYLSVALDADVPSASVAREASAGPLDARFAVLCGWAVALGAVTSQMVAPLSVHAVSVLGVPETRVGWLFSINGLMVVAFQAPLARLMRGRPITRMLAAGAVLYGLGYASVGSASGFAGLAAAIVVVTCGEMAVSPGMSTLTANLAGPGELGRYTGLTGFFNNVGCGLGPLLGGLGLQYLSPAHPALPWLLVAVVAAAIAAGFARFGAGLTSAENGFRPEAA